MEDYLAMASYRTLLIGDSCPSPASDYASFNAGLGDLRSTLHDQDFARMIPALDPYYDVFRSGIPSYIPGTLSGPWEGTWMASGTPLGHTCALVADGFLYFGRLPLASRRLRH